jgi:hypothetical protein
MQGITIVSRHNVVHLVYKFCSSSSGRPSGHSSEILIKATESLKRHLSSYNASLIPSAKPPSRRTAALTGSSRTLAERSSHCQYDLSLRLRQSSMHNSCRQPFPAPVWWVQSQPSGRYSASLCLVFRSSIVF